VFSATKPSQSKWHSRLGHPSLQIVHRILSQNKLPRSRESSNQMVCDACQMGKAHQLPYPKLSNVSSVPLELVIYDVWGPARESVRHKKYYVSFIYDFSKFVWIYILKHRSEVFEHFRDFQNLVERLFDQKIIVMHTDWG
jgi:hypothetical protein